MLLLGERSVTARLPGEKPALRRAAGEVRQRRGKRQKISCSNGTKGHGAAWEAYGFDTDSYEL